MCVHCSFRGADFRPNYCAVANLRSLFSSSPFLCLSSTLTWAEDVLDTLQLRRQDVYINALLPDRQNISVDVVYSLVLNWKNFAHLLILTLSVRMHTMVWSDMIVAIFGSISAVLVCVERHQANVTGAVTIVRHCRQQRKLDMLRHACVLTHPNIFVDVRHCTTYSVDQLAWLASELQHSE